MTRSIFYRSATLYRLLMRALYGHSYHNRHARIAELIPEGSSVTELCCGPGLLFEECLRDKKTRYLGLDINHGFVQRIRSLGGEGRVADLHDPGSEIPPSDVVLMQASMYHFLPDEAPGLLLRMAQAASQSVILAEPINNLSQSNHIWMASISQALTDPGTGRHRHRFDEESLDRLVADSGLEVRISFLIEGGREKVFVLDPSGGQ